MTICKQILPEFDHEMANTRRTLERIPDDKFNWRPHPKSWTLGELATHLGKIPSWAVHAIDQDTLDVRPAGGPPPRMEVAKNRAAVLDEFDKNTAAAREKIAACDDEYLLKSWTLLSGGQTILTLPRIAVIRSFIMNHNIHHRAQLGVYLRLNDLPVPAIYGPSADEGSM